MTKEQALVILEQAKQSINSVSKEKLMEAIRVVAALVEPS